MIRIDHFFFIFFSFLIFLFNFFHRILKIFPKLLMDTIQKAKCRSICSPRSVSFSLCTSWIHILWCTFLPHRLDIGLTLCAYGSVLFAPIHETQHCNPGGIWPLITWIFHHRFTPDFLSPFFLNFFMILSTTNISPFSGSYIDFTGWITNVWNGHMSKVWGSCKCY